MKRSEFIKEMKAIENVIEIGYKSSPTLIYKLEDSKRFTIMPKWMRKGGKFYARNINHVEIQMDGTESNTRVLLYNKGDEAIFDFNLKDVKNVVF